MKKFLLSPASMATVFLTASCVSARKLFHFGDSYSTTRFQYTGAQPSTSNPIGNPAFPGTTYAGGINWVGDLIKGRLFSSAVVHRRPLTLIPAQPTSGGSPTFVYNYAYPGAVFNSTISNSDRSIPDFQAQAVAWYQQLVAPANNITFDPAHDVFSVYFGTNDINISGSNTTVFPAMWDSWLHTMGELYNAGARRFLIFGMDPIWRAPNPQNYPDKRVVTLMQDAVQVWNTTLASHVQTFQRAYAGTTVHVFATDPWFGRVLDHPTQFGAPNALCANSDGKSCLWWDGLHPGLAIQKSVSLGVQWALGGIGFF